MRTRTPGDSQSTCVTTLEATDLARAEVETKGALGEAQSPHRGAELLFFLLVTVRRRWGRLGTIGVGLAFGTAGI